MDPSKPASWFSGGSGNPHTGSVVSEYNDGTTVNFRLVDPDALMNGSLLVSKVTDPGDAASHAWSLRIDRTAHVSATTLKYRTELASANSWNQQPRGTPQWLVFAARIPESWRTLATDDLSIIWQLHGGGNDSDVPGGEKNPPMSGRFIGGGPGTPQNSRLNIRMDAQMRFDPVDPLLTLNEHVDHRVNVDIMDVPADTWIYMAVNMLEAVGPEGPGFFKVWVAYDGGPLEQVANYEGPTGYAGTETSYPKCGMYRIKRGELGPAWAEGETERVILQKGLYRWTGQQNLTAQDVIDAVRSIR